MCHQRVLRAEKRPSWISRVGLWVTGGREGHLECSEVEEVEPRGLCWFVQGGAERSQSVTGQSVHVSKPGGLQSGEEMDRAFSGHAAQPRTRDRGAAEDFLIIWPPHKSATPLGDAETEAWRSPSIA